ncbi:MAG: hypothetical protein ABDH16_00435 [Thermodesulfovibrionaceae bacterium]
MNFFVCINDALRVIHKNYQLLFIHFLFVFVAFFSLFFIMSVPLGVLFIVFGIDLTEILRGSFFEIVISSISLLRKFLIIAIVFLVTLLVYIVFVSGLWIYIFSGTVGIMYMFLDKNINFKWKNFHRIAKSYFWKVAVSAVYYGVIFIILTIVFTIIREVTITFINSIEKFSHFLSVFLSVFIYLSLFLSGIFVFLIWITYTFFGFFGIFVKKLTVKEAIKESKTLIKKNPKSIGMAALLFAIYILMGGVILFFTSLLAIIPHVGAILVAIYQLLTQFAHVYISLVVFAAFFVYYLRFIYKEQSESDKLRCGD